MAIYHFSAQIISRGQGKSCVAAAAYRSGEKIENEVTGSVHDYTRKERIEYTEIMAPEHAPEWATDRSRLWNEVEKIEKTKDSQLAREINIALPVELNTDQQKDLIRNYVKENFVDKGMVADISIHDKHDGNPHAHVMLTIRPFKEDGSWGAKSKKEYILDDNGQKTYHKNGEAKSRKIESTDWNKKETLESWREHWANHANKALEYAGFQERIDHRSYKDQGIDLIPTVHLGKTAAEMQKKGIENPRVTLNEQIKDLNQQKVVALQEYRELKVRIQQEKESEFKRYSYLKENEKAAVIKAEKIIGEPLSHENSGRILKQLDEARRNSQTRHDAIDKQIREVEGQIRNIRSDSARLQHASAELEAQPKNLFGQFKDKSIAEALADEIKRCKLNLDQAGYKSDADLVDKENKLKSLTHEMNILKENMQKMNDVSGMISQAVKALQNKEVREFYQEYKEVYPQTKYLTYDDMKAIKAVQEQTGKLMSYGELKAGYKKIGHRIEQIDRKLNALDQDGHRLASAKKLLDLIDQHKDKMTDADKKICSDCQDKLKAYGVKDRDDYLDQMRGYRISVDTERPKLQAELAVAHPGLRILNDALKAWDRASKEEDHKKKLLSNELNINKSKDRDEYEQDR